MQVETLSLLITLLLAVETWGIPLVHGKDYWDQRIGILSSEDNQRMGGDFKLKSEQERRANVKLMHAKLKELDEGFQEPITFPPAQNFIQASRIISKSSVFKIIKKMPKGAVLHAHDYKITSLDYVFHNITFRPNLYICDVNGTLDFKFFHKPSDDCHWQLLSDVRQNDYYGTIDKRIKYQLSMFAEDAAGRDIDAAWDHLRVVLNSTSSLMSYRPVFEDHLYQGLLEFYEDNVIYVELRTTLRLLYDLDGKEYGILESARVYKQVADRFVKDHPDFLGIKLIYCIAVVRASSEKQMDGYLSTARMLLENLPGFVVGLGALNLEDRSRPLANFADKFLAVSKDVPFFFSGGDTFWDGQATDQNLIDAVLLGSKRIGEGIAITKHPEVLELARQRGIAIEVLPIINQVLSTVDGLRNHPASSLFATNYPIVISNDLSGLWGATGLSSDFYEAFMGIMSRHADLRALKKLAINSIVYSCMNASEKRQAMEIWQQKWNQFVNKLAAGVI